MVVQSKVLLSMPLVVELLNKVFTFLHETVFAERESERTKELTDTIHFTLRTSLIGDPAASTEKPAGLPVAENARDRQRVSLEHRPLRNSEAIAIVRRICEERMSERSKKVSRAFASGTAGCSG